MAACKLCGRTILNDDELKRKEWCAGMRRLLILGTVQPEDHHENCFVSALMAHKNLAAKHAAISAGEVPADHAMAE